LKYTTAVKEKTMLNFLKVSKQHFSIFLLIYGLHQDF